MPATKLATIARTALFALALVPVANNDAAAQIFVSGFTNGLFCAAGATCVNPNTSSLQQAFILGTGGTNTGHRLTYSNSTFSGNIPSSGGNLALNNAASGFNWATKSVVTQNVNNFGAFYLGGGVGVTYSSPFSLWINFVNPTSGSLVFGGNLTGTAFVSPYVAGGVNLVFDTPTQTGITVFQNGNWATISVNINDPNIAPEDGNAVTGVISAHVTPEPVSLSLLGTGLLGLAGAARRRRRNNAQAVA